MAGKTDTRQKMINMMYLVFIAMLALNISKEVLATLGILNDDLESSISELESSSKISYDQINSNSDKLDYKIAAEMVGDMRTVSDDFYNFIQVVKDSLINSDENKYLKEVSVKSNRDSIITMTDYQIMDKSQILDEYLFNGDLYTENGDLFLEKFINYPLSINNILDQITQKENSSEKEATRLQAQPFRESWSEKEATRLQAQPFRKKEDRHSAGTGVLFWINRCDC